MLALFLSFNFFLCFQNTSVLVLSSVCMHSFLLIICCVVGFYISVSRVLIVLSSILSRIYLIFNLPYIMEVKMTDLSIVTQPVVYKI